jgi:D-inositol-3-phosphate glycosyltransferase
MIAHKLEVALLTGGADRPYAFGLATALMGAGTALDLIGNDELDSPEFRNAPSVRFLNLRGDQRPDVGFREKSLRVLKYYARLIRYTATARPTLFHILWNNKFEYFDRTLLMLWYRLLGKKTILTLHNVNGRRRDRGDTVLNRITLRIQYRLADHIFTHTDKMKQELIEEFAGRDERITVIPFGINNAVPNTQLTTGEARDRLGIHSREKTILFFGHIAPYKGLECLVSAFKQIVSRREDYRLVVAGRPKNCETYWNGIRGEIHEGVQKRQILLRDEFIPDEDIELYMKAADVLVLPYRYIYQSGVLFLGYSFGLPVVAADVGSLKDDIVEGKTGFVFRPEDSEDLARTIERYFASDLYAELSQRRREIRDYATKRNSWDVVAQITLDVYSGLTRQASSGKALNQDASGASADAKLS